MRTASILNRTVVFGYGVASYILSVGVLSYTAAFLGNFYIAKPLDAPARAPFWAALLTNLGLLLLFGVQHSVMARQGFKRWLTRFVPVAAERSTYMLFSCLALIALFAFWQPMGITIWKVENPAGRLALYATFAAGWTIVFAASFYIHHFDLFGLRQVWLHLLGKEYTTLKFATPAPYRIVRHPLYVGWLLTFWATPTMTLAHLVFALGATAYILIAIRYEERDLVAAHPEYEDYRRSVPMLIPRRKSAPPMSLIPPRGASRTVIAAAE